MFHKVSHAWQSVVQRLYFNIVCNFIVNICSKQSSVIKYCFSHTGGGPGGGGAARAQATLTITDKTIHLSIFT